jgi:hypothetical protein
VRNTITNAVGIVKAVVEAIWNILQPGPTQEEIDRASDLLVEFAFEAANAAGVRGRDNQARYAQRHKDEMLEAGRLYYTRKVHKNGAFLIARGVRNARLKNLIIELYRPRSTHRRWWHSRRIDRRGSSWMRPVRLQALREGRAAPRESH